MSFRKGVMLFVGFLLSCGCSAQDRAGQQGDVELANRKPAVAGQFYPGSADQLKEELRNLFSQADEARFKDVRAVISPHAGYVYSGVIAASSFNQMDPQRKYENVFIIASSHTTLFEGASIYCAGHYETPLGTVKVNLNLCRELIEKNSCFTFRPEVHLREHSIEVQLPFLQYRLGEDLQIIPVVIGSQSPEMCSEIADALLPFVKEENFFVISSDFSHYPEHQDAAALDKATARAIESGNPLQFLEVISDPSNRKVPGLATRACGWSSIATLMYMFENDPGTRFQTVRYRNSGDIPMGDKGRVVGYWSIVLTGAGDQEDTGFHLEPDDKEQLLALARQAVEEVVKTGNLSEVKDHDFSESIKQPCGAFVTLNKNGQLRGCIGRFDAEMPLYQVVRQISVAAATQDMRFHPVMPEELDEIVVEVSVLTPLRKITSVDGIILGKHGIYIRKGNQSGTFLPQVATETGWNLEEFLGHCARDKAGLGWDGWKEAELFIYEALVFSETGSGEH
ncbi:MAG: AmmeMemoRadiSam system protein B [Bacteroidales bacterium]|nr:AmmeMemoRadiSam system protein B [Bacteroidales bacterium]